MRPTPAELERLYAYPEVDRPWVRTDFVATLDGAAWTSSGTSGDLGGDIDHEVFGLMRSLCDVVVVGAGTARTEGYKPLTEDSVDQDVRGRYGLAPVPRLVLVTGSLDVGDRLRVPGVAVLTSGSSDPDRRAALESDGLEVLVHGEGSIDWDAALTDFAERGWNRVLCEGGPSLHGDLAAADLVDEVCLTIAPVLAVGDAQRIAHGDQPVDRPARLAHALDVDGTLVTRWVLHES